MNRHYRIEDSSDHKFKITRLEDNEIISPDADDPDYCKFLEWATTRKALSDTFVANEHTVEGRWSVIHHLDEFFRAGKKERYFCTDPNSKEEFFKYLKDRGIILYVESSESSDVPERHKHSFRSSEYITEKYFNGEYQNIYFCGSYNPSKDLIEVAPIPNLWLSKKLRHELHGELKSDISETRKHSLLPVKRAFLYIDISDFSQYDAKQQSLVIHSLTTIMNLVERGNNALNRTISESIESHLCIGDGYIVCLTDSMLAAYYAISLANKIETAVALGDAPVEYHYRMSVHVGDVYFFWDKGRNGWNYTGDGINDGKRVLEAIGTESDDIIFISDKVKEDITRKKHSNKASVYCNWILLALNNRGRKKDKHNKMHRVYELNHASIDDGKPTS